MFELTSFINASIIILGDKMSKTKYELICRNCLKEFVSIGNKQQKFCCRKCYLENRLNKKRKIINGIEYKKCKECNKFYPNNNIYFNISNRAIDKLHYNCKQCEREKRIQKWKNDDKYKKSRLKYIENNKEKIKEYRHNQYLKNRDYELEKDKNYNKKNRNIIRERERKYLSTEKGKQVNHLKTVKRRTRLNKLKNDFNLEQWEKCKNYFNNCCAYCGKKEKLTVEHFIPISKGGNTIAKNILPICKSCNSSKQEKDFEKWYKEQKFYSIEKINKINEYFKQI